MVSACDITLMFRYLHVMSALTRVYVQQKKMIFCFYNLLPGLQFPPGHIRMLPLKHVQELIGNWAKYSRHLQLALKTAVKFLFLALWFSDWESKLLRYDKEVQDLVIDNKIQLHICSSWLASSFIMFITKPPTELLKTELSVTFGTGIDSLFSPYMVW